MLLIGRCGRKGVTSVVAALKAHTTWWSSDQGWFNWNSRPGREIATHGVNEAESKSGLIKFYKSVGVRATEKGDGYEVTLDRYVLKSPAKKPLVLPSKSLAMAIAAEWQWQHSRIDPNTMPLMSLAATAIDMPQSRETVADTIVSYLSTDPVVCRVPEEDTDLFKMQGEIFDPVLDWICHELNVELEKTSSIFGAQLQPRDVAMIRNHILGMNAWKLSAFEQLSAASKSVCLALAGVHGFLPLHALLEASRIEETYQIKEWGLVEGGHDIDIAETHVRISAPVVFLDLLSFRDEDA